MITGVCYVEVCLASGGSLIIIYTLQPFLESREQPPPFLHSPLLSAKTNPSSAAEHLPLPLDVFLLWTCPTSPSARTSSFLKRKDRPAHLLMCAHTRPALVVYNSSSLSMLFQTGLDHQQTNTVGSNHPSRSGPKLSMSEETRVCETLIVFQTPNRSYVYCIGALLVKGLGVVAKGLYQMRSRAH